MEHKSHLMLEIEGRYRRPLELLLPEKYNKIGLLRMAEEMGISRGTLWYWFLKFGIKLRRVAISPDEALEIKKKLL